MGLSLREKRRMCQQHYACGIKRRPLSSAAGALVDGQISDAQLAGELIRKPSFPLPQPRTTFGDRVARTRGSTILIYRHRLSTDQ
jgi:hypothetical protein